MRYINKINVCLDTLFKYGYIDLSINELYKPLKKFLKKQDIIDLLYTHNGVEIYDITKYKKKHYDLVNNLIFYFIMKDNIKVSYDNYYYNKYFLIRSSKSVVLFDNVPMSNYIQYKVSQGEFSVSQVISLYKSLNNINIKKVNNRLIFNSQLDHYKFAIEICNIISKNNETFKNVFNNRKNQYGFF